MVHLGISERDFFFARACARIKRAAAWGRFFYVAAVIFAASFPVSSATAAADKITNAKTSSLVRNINAASLSVCLPAIESLGRSHDADAVAPMSKALVTESRPIVRRYLVDALGALRQTSALPALKLALNDSDTQVRQSAVAALGLFSSADAQGALADHAANEKNPAVRRSLAHQMRFSKWSSSRKALTAMSHDNDPAVRKMAADALPKNSTETK